MAETNAKLTSKHEAFLGLDVGKFAHWAYAVDRDGEVLLSRRVASYCGLAPSTQQSGASINYDRGHRGGNKPLKNLLVFSCNSLGRSKGYYGEYMRKCLAKGMKYKCALKATARKRMKVIYAVMRDGVPYSA